MRLNLGVLLACTHVDIVYEFAPFYTTRSLKKWYFCSVYTCLLEQNGPFFGIKVLLALSRSD